MIEACYLLDMRQGQAMKEKMKVLLDKERLLKYQRMQGAQGKLLSLGAGALIRLAVMEYRSEDECKKVRRLTPKSLLSLTEKKC